MKKMIFPLLSVLALAGCAAPVSTMDRSDVYYESLRAGETGETQSLFTSDEAILSADDIAKILAHRYTVPPHNRIGVIALGRAFWFGYSEELARTGTDIQTGMVARLRASPRVYDASYLPTLLIPEKRTVGHYREAAARYQADLLLVYQAACRTYDKYRFLAPDEAKSYCNVEAVVLDIRTGIVPFTVTASRDFHARENKEDTNFRETMARAELKALADALEEVGDEVVGYLARNKG
ncbi:MAG: lipoprotein [Proteobacteria bacterium]|nr:lipoprotein [Pseudomonadota bacterium]